MKNLNRYSQCRVLGWRLSVDGLGLRVWVRFATDKLGRWRLGWAEAQFGLWTLDSSRRIFGSGRGSDLGSGFVFFARLSEEFWRAFSLFGNVAFDVLFPPFSFVSESPLPPILVYGVCLARISQKLLDLKRFKNSKNWVTTNVILEMDFK